MSAARVILILCAVGVLLMAAGLYLIYGLGNALLMLGAGSIGLSLFMLLCRLTGRAD